jgi:Ca2+-binding EF-hand superfamily protein
MGIINSNNKKDKNYYNMEVESLLWHTRFKKKQIKIILDRWRYLFYDKEVLGYRTWKNSINLVKKKGHMNSKWVRKVPSKIWDFIFYIFSDKDNILTFRNLVIKMSELLKGDIIVKNSLIFNLIHKDNHPKKNIYTLLNFIRHIWKYRIEKCQHCSTKEDITQVTEYLYKILRDKNGRLDYHKFIELYKNDIWWKNDILLPIVELTYIFLPINYQ